MIDTIYVILAALGVGVPSLAAVINLVNKTVFYVNAIKQAILLFNELRDANQDIFERVKNDPKRKELAALLSGKIKKINGLPGIKID